MKKNKFLLRITAHKLKFLKMCKTKNETGGKVTGVGGWRGRSLLTKVE